MILGQVKGDDDESGGDNFGGNPKKSGRNPKQVREKSKTSQEEIDVEMKKNKQQHFGRLSGGKNVGTIEDQRETWLL